MSLMLRCDGCAFTCVLNTVLQRSMHSSKVFLSITAVIPACPYLSGSLSVKSGFIQLKILCGYYSIHPLLRMSRFIPTCVPTSICEICENISFFVDVDHIEDQEDVLADDMGVLKNYGVDTSYVHATLSKRKVTHVEKCGPPSSSSDTHKVKRVYRTHATDGTLKKLTAYIHGKIDVYMVYG